jgi:S1-C subfamily serine protease
MRLLGTLVAAQIIITTFNPQHAAALTTAEIVAKAKPTVVAIEQIDTINDQTLEGTGWFCGDGKTVVTNAHVLKGTYNVLKVYNVATGKEYTIDHVNYLNPKDDVAALTVREENDAFLAISDVAPVEGSNVTVIGNPMEHYGTVTTGIVSALRTDPKAGSIMQISAPVSHGSSGSPVLNDNGEVIGMVWGGDPQNDAHDLNYAVPQEILKSDLFGISAFNIGAPLTFATLPSTQTLTSVTPPPSPSSKNAEAGKKFLKENAKTPGVHVLRSGLQYKVIKAGTGPKPKDTDVVIAGYRGTSIDGKEFDSSVRNGGPVSFPVNGVIEGWREALKLMPVGSKWEIYVPSELAYGNEGAGDEIAPGETLVFQVELFSIKKPNSRR